MEEGWVEWGWRGPELEGLKAAYARFFHHTLAELQGLELKARMIVEGYVAGVHKSPYKGFSVEFAEHRPYTPGDDTHDLDWRVLAKSDRYYIKQFIEETNLRATILLDASGSMKYTGKAAAHHAGRLDVSGRAH